MMYGFHLHTNHLAFIERYHDTSRAGEFHSIQGASCHLSIVRGQEYCFHTVVKIHFATSSDIGSVVDCQAFNRDLLRADDGEETD